MIEVRIRKSAEKEILRLDRKTRDRVIAKLEELAMKHPHRQARKILGHESIYRVRVGVYRVVYEYEGGTIYVFRVRHRSKAYEGL